MADMVESAKLVSMPDTPLEMPHFVVAGMLVGDGEVLLSRRSASRTWYPGVWDFPGGHVNDFETPAEALVRELKEELGVRLEQTLGPQTTRLLGQDFDLLIWAIQSWQGMPENKAPEEHDDLGWFSAEEAEQVPLADPAYVTIISDVLERRAVRQRY